MHSWLTNERLADAFPLKQNHQTTSKWIINLTKPNYLFHSPLQDLICGPTTMNHNTTLLMKKLSQGILYITSVTMSAKAAATVLYMTMMCYLKQCSETAGWLMRGYVMHFHWYKPTKQLTSKWIINLTKPNSLFHSLPQDLIFCPTTMNHNTTSLIIRLT